MKHTDKRLGIPIVAACALCASVVARGDTVTDWNIIMQKTVAPSNAPVQARSAAIVQLAVFEAVNAITGDYEPYLETVAAPPWASPDAAAIAAAHGTLVTLFPGSTAALNNSRNQSLAAIQDSPAKEAGIAVGEAAAAAMLALRANDGSAEAGNVPYTPGTGPGAWQPLPGQTPLLPGWGQVTPFGLEAGSQFRLPPPPALRTGKYANDYNEVKLLGRIDSPFRPQDRTDVARFYAAASPVQVWNLATRQASDAQRKTLSENARIFALLAMAMGDASIAAFDTKYHYEFWRPQAAIRGGGIDGNRRTDPDPAWLPLIATPAFPSYASAHATLSNAARAVLERSFGKHGHDITLTTPSLPAVVLHYTDWEQITHDIDDARIYGGIHFRFDQEAGAHQGRQVGKYILRDYLRSPHEEDDPDDDE
jgi:hypothetical protein